jgi:protein tyrosine phosphatase (PTP) superfamily phosphohydrolase (DUF442 family)
VAGGGEGFRGAGGLKHPAGAAIAARLFRPATTPLARRRAGPHTRPVRHILTTPAGRRAAWLNSLFVDHAVLRLAWRNWGVVEEGRLFRSNHPSPWQLRQAVRRFGITTVINLRGRRDTCGSDALGRGLARELGLEQIDAPLESRGAPQKDRIFRLATIFMDLTGPALIHCKSGADRTGLAAGIWILQHGGTVQQALAQLSWRFGHVSASNTGILDAFFKDYARFIRDNGDKPFLDWVAQDYDEAALRQRFRGRPWANRLVDSVLRRE